MATSIHQAYQLRREFERIRAEILDAPIPNMDTEIGTFQAQRARLAEFARRAVTELLDCIATFVPQYNEEGYRTWLAQQTARPAAEVPSAEESDDFEDTDDDD